MSEKKQEDIGKKLRKMYKTLEEDIFPEEIKITLGEKEVIYKKKTWVVNEEEKGLRYGDNPGQPAAMYIPVNGNFEFGEVKCIQPGKTLTTSIELLQSGKHPGMINVMDVDRALNILKYLTEDPTVVIMKHNNPCGVASRDNLAEAYNAANLADRIAAFGGAIALNRAVDKETAELIAKNYSEVVVAPEYEAGALELLMKRKNLRIMRIENMDQLQEWQDKFYIDFKSLGDGGLILQMNYNPRIKTVDDLKEKGILPKDIDLMEIIDGKLKKTGKKVSINREPTEREYQDMLFGWLVESGVTSNSVIYVKDKTTIGIGTGEQDRVGVAKIARDKAYEKLRDRLCFEKHRKSYDSLALEYENSNGSEKLKIKEQLENLDYLTKEQNGGLRGAVMVSDGFFPFRDGPDVGLEEGISAIIQPGGSNRDYETIIACNERNATMIYTGQRSFKH